MLKSDPVILYLFPDECWLPVLRTVVEEFCITAAFPESLVETIVSSTELAAMELIRQSAKVQHTEQFGLGLSYRDGACIVELIYDEQVPLDPVEAQEELSIPRENLPEVPAHTTWLELIKRKMDRVFFRLDGKRRVLEMRSYHREQGRTGQYWLMGLSPKISEGVKVDVHYGDQGNPVSSVLHNVENGKVLMMDVGGTFVIQRLDGEQTFFEIYMEYIDKISLTSPEHLAMIFTSLEEAGMLESDGGLEKKQTGLARVLAGFNKALFRSVVLPHSDRVVDAMYQRVQFLFYPAVTALILLFALSGFYPMLEEVHEVHEVLSKPALAIHANPWMLVELYLVMTMVTVLHELAHGLTCRHFGGSVHRLGIMFYLAMIIFYSDVSSAWGFRSKWKRIAVAAAGPILNLVVMSFCFWVWHFSKEQVPPEHSIWFLTGFFCLYSTVINFVPFIKMDGYYMLSDLVGIPTLREKSFAYMRQRLSVLAGLKGRSENALHPNAKQKWIFWGYGVTGMMFTVVFFAFPFFEFFRS
jgi:hypothetical protein